MLHKTLFCIALVALAATPASGDWLRFRGPNGSGISDEAIACPVTWSPESIKWKVSLPGPGSSCPIVVGDKVFVTCWIGYATEAEGQGLGDQKDLRRLLVCLDRKSGETIWSRAVEAVLPEDRYGGMFAQHGYASHTPVSDGERVFAFFGKSGVIACDMDGNQLWQTSVGLEFGARNWGSASSPILYENLVIVPATAESESIVALDKTNGSKVWTAEAAGFNSTWGTPLLAKINDDRTDIVIAIPGEVWGLNPNTGKLAWYADGVPVTSICSSAVVDKDGVVYAMDSGRDGGGGIAIRAGGSKDVSAENTIWSGRQSNRISTPLVVDGKLYTIASNMLTCMDTATGKEVYRERLRSRGTAQQDSEEPGRGGGRGGRGGFGGQDYGSPIVADGKIYYTSRAGDTFVLKLGDKVEQLAVNRVTNDLEDFSATPAVSNGELYIRSDKHMYCVAK